MKKLIVMAYVNRSTAGGISYIIGDYNKLIKIVAVNDTYNVPVVNQYNLIDIMTMSGFAKYDCWRDILIKKIAT